MARRKTLSAQIAEELKKKIEDSYKPGDKIPNEMELADELEVSRTTIREAIKTLCSENYLEIRRGKGTFVCENPGMDSDPLGYSSIDKEALYEDMLEVTLVVEPVLAKLAARKAKPENIEKMSSINLEAHEKLRAYWAGEDVDVNQFRIYDLRFHKAMIECCRNQVIDRTIRAFLSDAVEWGEVWKRIDHEKVLRTCEKHHRPIVEAITAHDQDRAYELAQSLTQEIIDIFKGKL